VTERPAYFYNFDGLRGLAALAVVFYHLAHYLHYPETSFHSTFKYVISFGDEGGRMGVTFFFMLSGFLITWLMMSEQQRRGSVHIGFFYMRRVLRIWPLYFFSLLVGFWIYPGLRAMTGHAYEETANPLWYATFLANFDNLYNEAPVTGILGVQWTVAIEEQFYLAWPLLFVLCRGRRSFPVAVIALLALSQFFVLFSDSSDERTYHTLSNLRFLAMGALLARLVYNRYEQVTSYLLNISGRGHFLIYFLLPLALFTQAKLIGPATVRQHLGDLLMLLFFSYVILQQGFAPGSFLGIRGNVVMTWLGKMSYGIYLTHMMAIYFVMSIFPPGPHYALMQVVCALVLTLVFSYLSYTYFESAFLSLKRKFQPVSAVVA
jgi:peptidoglycan/LPS O-acetylase OafA/YrhL